MYMAFLSSILKQYTCVAHMYVLKVFCSSLLLLQLRNILFYIATVGIYVHALAIAATYVYYYACRCRIPGLAID